MPSPVTLAFIAQHPSQAARLLELEAPHALAAFIAHVDPATTARIVEHLTTEVAAASLHQLDSATRAAVLAALPMHISSALLRRMPTALRREALARLPGRLAVPLRLVLGFAPDTVGAHTDPHALAVSADVTAGTVAKLARRAPESLQKYVYVLDGQQRLVGAVDARRCLLASRATPIGALVTGDPITLRASTPLVDVVDDPVWDRFNVLPVVDRNNTFIGALTRRALMGELASSGNERPNAGLAETVADLADLYWDSATSLFYGIRR